MSAFRTFTITLSFPSWVPVEWVGKVIEAALGDYEATILEIEEVE